MSEQAWIILISLVAGLAMGAVFFGGLLLTTRRLARASHPAALVLVSFAVRAVVVGAGFAVLVRYGWLGPAAAMLGFLIVRLVLTRIALAQQQGATE